jgi:hypothetical protein
MTDINLIYPRDFNLNQNTIDQADRTNSTEQKSSVLSLQASSVQESEKILTYTPRIDSSLFPQPNSEISLVELTREASSEGRRTMAAGIAHGDNIFITWSGPDMRPQVAQCHRETLECRSRDLGAIREVRDVYDFHDYTHLVRTHDGTLHVFYSNHSQHLWHIRSSQPDNIDGSWHKSEITYLDGAATNATYPMPVVSNDGTLFVFFRQTTETKSYRPINFVKSTDNGLTWSEPQAAIDFQNSRSDHLNEIYVGRMIHDKETDRILMSWTLSGGGPEYTSRDTYHKNVFFASFDPKTNQFYAVTGQELGSSIDNDEAINACLAYDSGSLDQEKEHHINYKPLVHKDPKTGWPLIAFYDFNKEHAYLAKWDGQTWQHRELPFDPKEFTITPEGNLQALYSQDKKFYISESLDSGESWQQTQAIDTPEHFNRMIAITDIPDLFLTQHITKTEFDSMATTGNVPTYLLHISE